MTVPASRATWAGPDGPAPRRDADAVFALLAESVLSVFGAEGAFAAQLVGGQVVARASVGTCGPPAGATIPRGATLAGLVLGTLEPQICHDGDADPRTRGPGSTSTCGRARGPP